MNTFKDYVNEGNIKIVKEVEDFLLKLKPRAFIKKVQNLKDKSWYWAYRDGLVIYQDQNSIDGSSYQAGSLYDILRNYRYNGTHMTSKVKAFIDSELPFVMPKSFEFSRTYTLGNGTIFTIEANQKILTSGIKRSVEKNANMFLFFNKDFNISSADRYFNMSFNTSKSFNWNTYRDRKKVSPIDTISKLDLFKEMHTFLKDIEAFIIENSKHRELVVLAMIDKVITDNFILDNSEMIDAIKIELRACKDGSEASTVLSKHNFSEIPEIRIMDELIQSDSFTYTNSRPDGYGHTTGTQYRINFQKSSVLTTGFSSDD